MLNQSGMKISICGLSLALAVCFLVPNSWITLSNSGGAQLQSYGVKFMLLEVDEVTFDEIIEKVLDHEGGYVNDPKDLGGETKYGITKRFYPDLDIKNLTKDQAKEIYKKDYWDKNKVDQLPERLRHVYFDMCVNMGKRTAVKILQRAAVNQGQKIKVDGGLGPITIEALANVPADSIQAYRVKYYVDLINKKPEQEKFFLGWFRRAKEV